MSKDNDATTLQEYLISGIVISFFGLLYFYLSGDFDSDTNKQLPIATASQGYALTSLGSDEADKLRLQDDAKATFAETKKTVTPSNFPDTEETSSEEAAANGEPSQAKKLVNENINLDEMKVQVDDNAQKLDEIKQQLDTNQPVEAAVKEEAKRDDDAANGLVFKLPDGRQVEIPSKGFENTFKEAIVKGDRNTPIIFDRVYFDTGSKNLNSQSDYQIASTAALLNTYKEINIVIRGHSDNKGSSKKNAQLSLFRSGSMKKALVDLGIDSRRIHIEGLGEIEPIDSNKTKRGRRNNRRIDLVIKE